MRKSGVQYAVPAIVGIVVGVERSRETGAFHSLENRRNIGCQGALQKQRRHMKMPRGSQIIEVEILQPQLGDRAEICQYVAVPFVWKDHGYARASALRPYDSSYIDSGSEETCERQFSQLVVAHFRDESHPAAERREIVRYDRGRTSQRHAEPAGQQLALGRYLLRQAVEDQIKIDLSRDGNVENGQEAGLWSPLWLNAGCQVLSADLFEHHNP